MRLRPRARSVAALFVLASMLFMQLAIAGYACPGLEMANPSLSASENSSMESTHQGMRACHEMDKVQPNLCHAHAQAGTQSLDKPELPLVQPFIAGTLTAVFREIEIAVVGLTAQPNTLLLTRTTAPPLSIQHCCFRI